MLQKFYAKFNRDEEGQGMAEYGLVIALVAIAAIGAFSFLGTKITTVISSVGSAVNP